VKDYQFCELLIYPSGHITYNKQGLEPVFLLQLAYQNLPQIPQEFMQCFQAGEDMLLSGARVFQRSPAGKLTILLKVPQAKQERTVPHFLCDHVFMSVRSLYCVRLERWIVLYWQAGKAW
jgi:hypothetical protein